MNKVLAQSLTIPWGKSGTETIEGVPGVTFTNIGEIIAKSLSLIFLFAGTGLLLMLLSGGFTFLTSAGDPKMLEKGKATITNSLIGFVIIFASFWIVQALGIVFGIDSFTTLFR